MRCRPSRTPRFEVLEEKVLPWRMKTSEYLPDGTASWGDNDRRITFTNEIGLPLLSVFADVGATVAVTGLVRAPSIELMARVGAIIPPPTYPPGTFLVSAPGHGFVTGDRVALAGVLPKLFNGIFTVTRIDADTFSFVLPSTYDRDAGATPYVNQTVDGVAIVTTAARVLGEWATYYRYDAAGRLILQAEPSAVSGYDDNTLDLLKNVSGDYQYLRNSAGLIRTYEYFTGTTATATTPGSADGLIKATFVKQGETGTAIVQASWTYYARTSGGSTLYEVATDTTYGLDSGSASDFSDRNPRTTTYTYTWFTGTNRVESMTISKPVVAASQNGPGTADVSTAFYDTHGRMTWLRDAAGFIHYTAYDRITGAILKTIVDVNTSSTSDFSGLPSGWTIPAGGGLHLIDAYQVDDLGRTVKWTNPRGDVTWSVYNDGFHEVRVYRGWNATTHATTGPIEVYREYRPASGAPSDQRAVYVQTLTSNATPSYDATTHAPTGTETFSSANIQSLHREVTNGGGQTIAVLDFFSLTDVTYATTTANLGTASNDSASGSYHGVTHGYDHRGRVNRIATASGTIYRTVYDGLGRVIEEWVGTNDTGATADNPAGGGSPNNMFRRASYQYDGGGIGDGNLTSKTEYPDAVAANARVTAYVYDWRDRLVATKQGVQASESTSVNRPLIYLTLNNLGEVTSIAVYDGDGVTPGTTAPSSSLRRASVSYAYDNQGRLFRTSQYDVNQSTGALSSSALTTNAWYDRRGLEIKRAEPGGLVAKTAYDGAGRTLKQLTTDGGGDTAWTDADDVTGDAVLGQVEYAYDAAGNLTFVTRRDRFHDAAGTGELGTPTTGVNARVSYAAHYYDAAGRLTASANVGTNGGSAYTRPGTVPSRTDTVLVTSYTRDAAGRVETVTDPRGIVARSTYDLLGRVTKTIEAYTNGVPTDSSNKTVEYTYNGLGNVLTLSVVLPSGSRQTTRNVYAATPAGGSSFSSNDVLSEVRHPDKSTGSASASEADLYGYNALGGLILADDRNGNIHAYSYDTVGRRTADAVTTLGSGVDGAVRRLETAYDAAGRTVLLTSSNAASGGSIVDQVQRTYNGLGQVTAEYQAHGGAVNVSTTPKVQYTYSLMAGGANHSRLGSVTYPSGARVDALYGATAGDLDDRISRLTKQDFRSPTNTALTSEAYTYLGLDTIVRKVTPASTLSYIQQAGDSAAITDGGDKYTGLDRFGRVVDQVWRNGSGTVLDRFQYGYDRGGNRLYEKNLVEAALSELYAYDPLGQLTSFKRGVLSDTNSDGIPDAVSSPSRSQAWDLDALGNWEQITSDGTAQNRTHNAQNQVTGVGGSTLTFDANGNMTKDEAGRTFAYDAWNRPVAVRNASSVLVATYAYDALGRRTIEVRPVAGTTDHLYYSTTWQLLEERRGGTAASNLSRQYLWGPDYVDALSARLDYASGTFSTVRYAQYDANWNVTSIADASSGVLERYLYDPYGATTILAANWTSRGASLHDWKHLHQGGRWDADAGLYQFRNREYSPTLGRWNRVDPIGFDGGDTNLYRYVGDAPLDRSDSSGLFDDGAQGMTPGRNRPPRPTHLDKPTQHFIVNDYGPNADWVNWMHSCVSRPYPGYAVDAKNLDDAVNQILAQLGPNDRIGSLQFWGHGSPASVCIGGSKLRGAVDPTNASVYSFDQNNPLIKLLPFLDKDSKVVFKTCNTFRDANGKKFAQDAAKFFGCTVGGHTDFIGKGLQYPGYQELKPGETPSWPNGKGSGEKENKPKPKDKNPVNK